MFPSPARSSTSRGFSDTQIASVEARLDDLERYRKTNAGRFETPAELSLALGSAYFRSGSAEDAEREWKAAVAVNKRMGEAHNNLAALYMALGRLEEAESELKLAERAGYRVHPQFKKDLQARRRAAR